MNRWIMPAVIIIAVPAIVVGVTAAVVARGDDAPPAASAGTGARIWIDHPVDGATYALGVTIPVRWHASHPGGIAAVRVLANDESLFSAEDLGADRIVSRRHEWTPSQPGEYVLRAEASGKDDATASLRVTVAGDRAPAATPTASAASPAAPTASARPLRSSTPVPPATPPPGPATPSPAATPTRAVPPSATATTPPTTAPTSTATKPPPTATATPDTEGPPAPEQVAPKGTEFDCGASVVLTWLRPDDPSGIQSYGVQVEHKVTATTWAAVGTYVVLGTSKNLTEVVDCGVIYRWRVRALDNALNIGPYSGWEEFGVALP